MNERTNLTN